MSPELMGGDADGVEGTMTAMNDNETIFAQHDPMLIDGRITPLAFRLSWLLASQYLDRRAGYAQVSVDTLAKDLGVAPRSIKVALELLRSCGYWRRDDADRVFLIDQIEVPMADINALRELLRRATGA
jgi:hypothetical protein